MIWLVGGSQLECLTGTKMVFENTINKGFKNCGQLRPLWILKENVPFMPEDTAHSKSQFSSSTDSLFLPVFFTPKSLLKLSSILKF